jgi:hypothetical protein
MNVDVFQPITADPKLNGEGLCAIMCRVKVKDGKVTVILGDHVQYHAEGGPSGTVMLRNTGPVNAAAKAKAKK